jgi:two-component system response regulator FixJ
MIAAFPDTHSPLTPATPDGLVCVVDDDEAVRCSLERLLRSARFQVKTYASAADYLGCEPNPGPVCLVIDVRMPGIGGFEFQKMLADKDHDEQVVFLTGHGDVPMCAKAMKAGALDFLTKPADDEILLSAVTRALERARAVGSIRAEKASARKILDNLTPREQEVMERVLAGLLNKQIAAELGIAEKTVKIHRGRVMKKTCCVSVPDLLRLALRADGASIPLQPV